MVVFLLLPRGTGMVVCDLMLLDEEVAAVWTAHDAAGPAASG
jgi:hypothetical protein